MTASGYNRAHTTEARFVRLGRKATKHVRTLFDRFWLQAADQRSASHVGLAPNTGYLDAEYPLLIAQRTHADDP